MIKYLMTFASVDVMTCLCLGMYTGKIGWQVKCPCYLELQKGGCVFMDTGYLTPRNNQYTQTSQSTSSVIDQEPEKDTSFLRWWYRFTAPNPVPASASLQEREISRRGRLTSATLLVVIFLVLAAEPSAIFGNNKSLIFILLIPVFIDIIALIFNKLGKITTAGILVVFGIEVGLTLSILGPALGGGGLDTYTLPQYDLLVQASFVAVTLLPAYTVFIVTIWHTAFTIVTVEVLPKTSALVTALAQDTYGLFVRPITLQVIVAVVTYMWVTNTYQALKRADRAEVIAELEHRETDRQQQELMLKQQLDEGIQEILQTHVQVANGDFSARTPLRQENVLWRISYSLNNLLARLQSLNYAEQELQKAQAETTRLAEAIHRAKQGQPLKLTRTGTHLDPLILELMSSPVVHNPGAANQLASHQDHPSSQLKGKGETRDFRS